MSNEIRAGIYGVIGLALISTGVYLAFGAVPAIILVGAIFLMLGSVAAHDDKP